MIDGFQHYSAYFGTAAQLRLLERVRRIVEKAPLYRPAMPRTGKSFSVEMTNCGTLGWISDAARGYRYEDRHPATGQPWPEIPDELMQLWRNVSCCDAPPQACLINYYRPGARLGSHVDADEEDRTAPVVSVSLGDDAVFHVGGQKRHDAKTRVILASGDVVVLGGPARLAYHGIDRIKAGTSGILAEGGRFNLTLRRVTRFNGDIA